MTHVLSLLLVVITASATHSQMPRNGNLIGGRCEGCEAVFEFGSRRLAPVDTLPDFHEPGPKLKISGTVFQADGRTPAAGVILYVYHTNQRGVYPKRGDERGWARRHGSLRGWVKTDETGKYAFYTLKPGTYPNRREPAHIHMTLLEPDGKYYWLHSIYFSDDPLLTPADRDTTAIRGGGNRVLTLRKLDGLLFGRRDIVLGKNVPGY